MHFLYYIFTSLLYATLPSPSLHSTPLPSNTLHTSSVPRTLPNITPATLSLLQSPSQSIRSDDVIPIGSPIGGVFAFAQSLPLIPANSFLPLPGMPGSLSNSVKIIIDPRIPCITGVRTTLSSGTYSTYSNNAHVPIVLTWTHDVVVGGCPFIRFHTESGDERRAEFKGGSGSKVLTFVLEVEVGDVIINLDYSSTHSLVMSSCPSLLLLDPFERPSPLFIKRASQSPCVDANTTLPHLTVRYTVISPTSITGGSTSVNFTSTKYAPTEIFTTLENVRTYTIGDVVDINIRFPIPISVNSQTVYLVLTDFNRVVYFSNMLVSSNQNYFI